MNVIQDFISAFFEQPPRILIVMGLVLFGRILKRSERVIDAKWIPVILPIIGIVAFPAALSDGVRTIGKLAVEGFVGGCLAVWINQAYRQLFASKLKGSPLGEQLEGDIEEIENADQTHKKEGNITPCGCVHCGEHGRPGGVAADTGVHQPPEQNHP